jgi:NAD(P)-dependent dehydrogenase (short-subunit alcohol dehydrogenase family)
MDLGLSGKHALVTGWTAGIGYAIAKGRHRSGLRLGGAAKAVFEQVPELDILVNNLGICGRNPKGSASSRSTS